MIKFRPWDIVRLVCQIILLTPAAFADCQLAIVDAFAPSVSRLQIVGASGKLARSIEISGKPARVAVSPGASPRLFMAEIQPTRITSIDLNGSDYSTVVERSQTPLDVAVHNNVLYWSEDTPDETDQAQGAIYRANLDGSNVELIVGGLTNPSGFDFGPDGKLYWTSAVLTADGSYNIGEVYRANLDGSDALRILDLTALAATSVPGGTSRPTDVLVDALQSQILITDLSSQFQTVPGRIWKAGLDGSNPAEFARFAGCPGSANCAPELSSNLAYNAFLNAIALSDRNNTGGRIKLFDAASGTSISHVSNLKTGSGIAFLGTEEGLCMPSGNMSGTSNRNFTVWRPSTGTWFEKMNNAGGLFVVRQWGLPGDIPLFSNFNGDSFSDLVVFRPSLGSWYLCDWDGASACRSAESTQWGLPSDIPVAGDFNGDSLDEIVVWRPSEGNWYNNRGTFLIRQWGLNGDLPLTDDFNSDGRDDFVVWRQSNGTWFILFSSFTGQQPDDSVTLVRFSRTEFAVTKGRHNSLELSSRS